MYLISEILSDKMWNRVCREMRDSVVDINENVFYYSGNKTIDVVFLNHVCTQYPLHTHALHYTMGIVVDGDIVIETNQEKYICQSDNFFTIPMDTPHSISPYNNCPYTMICFCIHHDYLICTDINEIKLMIEKKLNRVFNEGKVVDRYLELFSDGLVLLLAGRLEKASKDSYTKDVKHKLLETKEISISIEDISKEICVSTFHMIRQFKKEVGLTPHQFQIQCRIRKAQKLLLSDRTIAEVALDTGFCDQSHFVRCFKKIVGITPASYKKVAEISKEQE